MELKFWDEVYLYCVKAALCRAARAASRHSRASFLTPGTSPGPRAAGASPARLRHCVTQSCYVYGGMHDDPEEGIAGWMSFLDMVIDPSLAGTPGPRTPSPGTQSP